MIDEGRLKSMEWHEWIEELADRISADISNTKAEPVNGDETEFIGRMLVLELDFRHWNYKR